MLAYLSLQRYAVYTLLTIAGVAAVIAIERYRDRPDAAPGLLYARGFLVAAGIWIAGWGLAWIADLLPTWEMGRGIALLIARLVPLLGHLLRSTGYIAMPALWLSFSLTSPEYDRRASREALQWPMLIPAALGFLSVVREVLLWAGGPYESLVYRYSRLLRALGWLTQAYVLTALVGGLAARWWRRGNGVRS